MLHPLIVALPQLNVQRPLQRAAYLVLELLELLELFVFALAVVFG